MEIPLQLTDLQSAHRLLPYLQRSNRKYGIAETFWQEYVNALSQIKTYQNKLDPYYYLLLPVRALFYGLVNSLINAPWLPVYLTFEGGGTLNEFISLAIISPTVKEIKDIKKEALLAEQKLNEHAIKMHELIESEKVYVLVQLLVITPAELLSSLIPALAEKKSHLYQALITLVEASQSLDEKLAYLDAALDNTCALFKIFNCQQTLYGKLGAFFKDSTNTIDKLQDYKKTLLLVNEFCKLASTEQNTPNLTSSSHRL